MRCRVMPSTAIRTFHHNPASGALDVTFVSGRRYRYFGVPAAVAAEFAGAPSKGRFFNARIRDRFRFVEQETQEQ